MDNGSGMIRGHLRVLGDVQEVGYRATVMKIAQKMGLKGYVQNVPDGTVEIICEGQKETIEQFADEIKIANEIMAVERVEVEYSEATGEFDGFTVKIPDMAYELFQGFATAGKYFHNLGKKVDAVGEKVDRVADKVDNVADKVDNVAEKVDNVAEKVDRVAEKVEKGFKEMGTKLDMLSDKLDASTESTESFHHEMAEKFEYLDEKYGEFGRKLDKIDSTLEKLTDKFCELVDYFINKEK